MPFRAVNSRIETCDLHPSRSGMIDIKRGGAKKEFGHDSNSTLRTNTLSMMWNMKLYLEQKGKRYKYLSLPLLFSVSIWFIMFNPNKAVQLMSFKEVFQTSTCEENNLDIVPPDDIYKIFLLGEISAKLKDRSSSSRNQIALLAKAREILNVQDRDLTAKDVIEILPEAIITKGQQKTVLQKLKGTVSFVGILSLISSAGIFVTLQPVLKMAAKAVHLDELWIFLRNKCHWMENVIPTILDTILYASSDLALIYSIQQSKPAVRSQMGVFSAGVAMTTFFTRTLRREVPSDPMCRHDRSLESFAWISTYLMPMALCTKSKVLGFFSIGALFGAFGFYNFPFPYWPDDFVTRFSNASLIILSLGLASKSGVVPLNKEATEIFEVGMAVFGMLSFGLTGLAKSFDYGAWGLAYPALWLMVAYLGSITSYTSLTNTSISFVVLWMWQFLFSLTGLTALSVFTSSCTLFGITLWLKQHPEFLRSLFKI